MQASFSFQYRTPILHTHLLPSSRPAFSLFTLQSNSFSHSRSSPLFLKPHPLLETKPQESFLLQAKSPPADRSNESKWVHEGLITESLPKGMFRVLVSIQGLILNAKPYFNEPGFAHMSGSALGEMRSLQYNGDAFLLSLKTMMYVMKKPPKHFEHFVAGHFCDRARDILVACKAYMDGAQVGCLVKGGVQDVDAGDRSCSKPFKDTLAGFVNRLVGEFSIVGAKDCEKFLPQAAATTENVQAGCNPDVTAPATGILSSDEAQF